MPDQWKILKEDQIKDPWAVVKEEPIPSTNPKPNRYIEGLKGVGQDIIDYFTNPVIPAEQAVRSVLPKEQMYGMKSIPTVPGLGPNINLSDEQLAGISLAGGKAIETLSAPGVAGAGLALGALGSVGIPGMILTGGLSADMLRRAKSEYDRSQTLPEGTLPREKTSSKVSAGIDALMAALPWLGYLRKSASLPKKEDFKGLLPTWKSFKDDVTSLVRGEGSGGGKVSPVSSMPKPSPAPSPQIPLPISEQTPAQSTRKFEKPKWLIAREAEEAARAQAYEQAKAKMMPPPSRYTAEELLNAPEKPLGLQGGVQTNQVGVINPVDKIPLPIADETFGPMKLKGKAEDVVDFDLPSKREIPKTREQLFDDALNDMIIYEMQQFLEMHDSGMGKSSGRRIYRTLEEQMDMSYENMYGASAEPTHHPKIRVRPKEWDHYKSGNESLAGTIRRGLSGKRTKRFNEMMEDLRYTVKNKYEDMIYKELDSRTQNVPEETQQPLGPQAIREATKHNSVSDYIASLDPEQQELARSGTKRLLKGDYDDSTYDDLAIDIQNVMEGKGDIQETVQKLIRFEETYRGIPREVGQEGFADITGNKPASDAQIKELRLKALESIKRMDNLGYDSPNQALRDILQEGPEYHKVWEIDPSEKPVIDAWAFAQGSKGLKPSEFDILKAIWKLHKESQEKNVTPQSNVSGQLRSNLRQSVEKLPSHNQEAFRIGVDNLYKGRFEGDSAKYADMMAKELDNGLQPSEMQDLISAMVKDGKNSVDLHRYSKKIDHLRNKYGENFHDHLDEETPFDETKLIGSGEEGFAKADKDQRGFNFDPIDIPGQNKEQAAYDLIQQILQAPESSKSKRDILGLTKKKKAVAETPLFEPKGLFK